MVPSVGVDSRMAGRPSLRIGGHGKISRVHLGGGLWLARCRYRDTDGVTRKVQRLGPPGIYDQYGKMAEDALIEALADRSPSSGPDAVSLETPVTALLEQHLVRLTEDGRSPVTLTTYRFAVGKLDKFIGGVRVGEASPARIDAALRSMRSVHGPTMARQAKTVLRGALQLAVMANILGSNPVRDVQPLRSNTRPKGAVGLTAEQLRDLLQKVQESKFCQDHDLVDPITLLIATGLRRSELLGLRWVDYDYEARTLTVAGKVVRVSGEGLQRVDETKSAAGRRTVPVPRFAVQMRGIRHGLPYLGEQVLIFPSTAGTLRDPNNFGKEWRNAREELGVPEVTTHSFRKTVATLIDDDGLSARIGADQLGHSKVSMTQDRYMTRGRVHTQVADLLDRAIAKSGE
jgi:integrase